MEPFDALLAATRVLPPDLTARSARFALVLRPSQDPVAVADGVRTTLADFAVRVRPLSPLEPRVLLVDLPGRVPAAAPEVSFEAAYALADAFGLEAAEPDLPTDFFPEEPLFAPGRESANGFPPWCWVAEDPELHDDPRWALGMMNVPAAWEFSAARNRLSRGEGVVVAQPDTGVTRHRELDGVFTVPGYDVLDHDDDPTDPLERGGSPGHGTATASVLVSPGSLVVTGTAPAALHMPIRAITSVVQISQVAVAEAIDWATAHGAQVITMSLGGLFSFSLHRALRRAVRADVVVLAAAGNCVGRVVWPARYDECVAVAGVNRHGRKWRGSCSGAAVDVSAPAENVLRARIPRGDGEPDHGQGQGTSFAVAMTAGVAALWLAHHGRANLVAEARRRGETVQALFLRLVRATARRPAEWDSFTMGAGVVDAEALLRADLDLGRERETLAGPVSEADTVRSLVAEAVQPEAADDPLLDWYRFGPEISHAVLAGRTAPAGASEAASSWTRPSPRLAKAMANPALQDVFGLDLAGAPEVGGTS
ncbi:S8 family serine peptidase [Saccharothrix sp. NPDC042600]|uniref:S8 family peptidase n=1 Tax=Saccharothrix TaxID=2071 RepID=UPI0033EAFFEB|nr:type VII secretion system ESX-1 serine protease mycosin MycP1 [Saccharothrix mutabilis subsp. capreolus]